MTQDQGKVVLKLDKLWQFVHKMESFTSDVTKIPVSYTKEKEDINKIIDYILEEHPNQF